MITFQQILDESIRFFAVLRLMTDHHKETDFIFLFIDLRQDDITELLFVLDVQSSQILYYCKIVDHFLFYSFKLIASELAEELSHIDIYHRLNKDIKTIEKAFGDISELLKREIDYAYSILILPLLALFTDHDIGDKIAFSGSTYKIEVKIHDFAIEFTFAEAELDYLQQFAEVVICDCSRVLFSLLEIFPVFLLHPFVCESFLSDEMKQLKNLGVFELHFLLKDDWLQLLLEGCFNTVFAQKAIVHIQQLISASAATSLLYDGLQNNQKGLFEDAGSLLDSFIDHFAEMYEFISEKLVFSVVALLEDIECVVIVFLQFQKLSFFVIANIIHFPVDSVIGCFVSFLPVVSQSISGSFDDMNAFIGDASIVFFEFVVLTFGNGISEAGTCSLLIGFKIVYSIDNDIDAVAAVGEHHTKTIQHPYLFVVQQKSTVSVLQGHYNQKPHFFKVGSHRSDVMKIYELAKPRAIGVPRHIHDSPLIIIHAAFVEIGSLSD